MLLHDNRVKKELAMTIYGKFRSLMLIALAICGTSAKESLLLVFCISAMVAAEALPAAAQEATTCSQRLALCNSRCSSAVKMGPAVCRDKCKSNHATCMRTGTFPVIGPYGPWPGLEKR